MEKRVLIAALLSAVLLSVYGRYMSARYPQDAVVEAPTAEQAGASPVEQLAEPSLMGPADVALEDRKTLLIESERLVLEIGLPTGRIIAATLKDYDGVGTTEPLVEAPE